MSKRTFHRCFLPSFGSFDQAVSDEKIFKNRPIRNKNGHHRQFLFLIGRFLKIFSETAWPNEQMRKVNGRRTASDGKSSHCLWQGELKKDYFVMYVSHI
jgi:hypothetical protein